jgi:predicted ATP-grasp superfamily ATP-dependent carboligase
MLPTHVLIAGVSTRAAADSAARAGFRVTAIDAFGDRDQHPAVTVVPLVGRFTPAAAARAAAHLECDAVVYLANFENHPRAIAALVSGRALWGNTPDAIRRVRNPALVSDRLRSRGIPTPQVRLTADPLTRGADKSRLDRTRGNRTLAPDRAWLLKPLKSGGGHRIQSWQSDTTVPRGFYLQEFVEGQSGSVVFVGSGNRAVPLGVSRQLVGEQAFGASGFQYCGSIVAPPARPEDDALAEAAGELCRIVAGEFGLVGLNGIDFVIRNGVPHAVEVNPRWSASMEIFEQAYGISLFAVHADASARGALPTFDLGAARKSAGHAVGKAVLYARHDATTPDTDRWLDREWIRDIPQPHAQILEGRPICTIITTAAGEQACYQDLVEKAELVYAELR